VTGYFAGIEGTPEARTVALLLALLAAVSHAVFGALQKGRHDPWLTRGAIDACYAAMALPVALFVVPWPRGSEWAILGGAVLIHLGYKLVQAMAYSRGAFTVVYPIVRGTGPLITVMAAGVVFGEVYSPLQWSGVLLLSGAIFGLAAVNIVQAGVGRGVLVEAVALAFVTGVFTAAYTTYDAFGIRQTPDPFTFLAWFFLLDGLVFPWIVARKHAHVLLPGELPALLRRGVTGGLVAYVSFGSIMLATRIDKVGQAAVLRETSVVFAALIGWLFLKERVGLVRGGLVGLIALGAVVMEFG
jgi:drug/metabolite transporter (DMT)-like permease